MKRYLRNIYSKIYDIIILARVLSPTAKVGSLGRVIAVHMSNTLAILLYLSGKEAVWIRVKRYYGVLRS